MSRRRFAVALMIPHPVSTEVEVLRLALGDRQLEKIGPHVTIIPPINLHDEQIVDAMANVEAAARKCASVDLTIGPIATFDQSSPVRFLAVEPWEAVVEIYRACWKGVFDRDQHRDFHPHVTVDIDGSPTDGADPAIDLLAGYRAQVHIDEITLLEFRAERSDDAGPGWESYVSYPLQR